MPITDVPSYGVFGSKRVDPNSKTPYSDATQCRKKRDRTSPHVRRPMNAFMVYAQLERNRMLELSPNLHNAEISKTLGRKWKLMSGEEKKPFVEEAALLKAMHLLEFPEYKYRPKKRGRHAKGGLLNNRSRHSNSRDSFAMAKADRNSEMAADDDLLDSALISETKLTNSCSNVDGFTFCHRLKEPFLSPGFSSKDRMAKIQSEATGVDTGPVVANRSNLCLELIQEDNSYRFLTPTVESSSEQLSQQSPAVNNRDLQMKPEDVDYDHNNNDILFFASFHPENVISNADSFHDAAEIDEMSDNAFFTDLSSSNIGQDALLDFIDDSLALYPYEYTTFFPEIPDPNEFFDLNSDFSGICRTN